MIMKLFVLILLSLLIEEAFLQVDAACDQTQCIAQSTHFCTCGLPDKPMEKPIPETGTCESIGCAEGGKYCSCSTWGSTAGTCQCYNRTQHCDPNECASNFDHQACYCYIGSDEAKKFQLPQSKNCSDLLATIGTNKGNNYCAMSVCKCDQFSVCSCNPPPKVGPKAFEGFPPNGSKNCGSKNCRSNSFEYCDCTCIAESCQNEFIKLVKRKPKTGICDGTFNTTYNCLNAGKKCRCIKDGECKCVEVDPLIPINVDNCETCATYSNKACICNYKDLRVKIDTTEAKCSSLIKSKSQCYTRFDSCPYQVGQECKCEFNPNNQQNQCFCRTRNQFQTIPPLNTRPNPNTTCAGDEECNKHTELYCYCTNSDNSTFIKELSHLQPGDAVEQVCTERYSQPPNIVCHPFGYQAQCIGGSCALSAINLYNTTDISQDPI